MTRTLVIRGLLLGVCLFGLGGATCQSRNPELQLPGRAKMFNESLRWHRFGDAAACLLPKDRVHFLQRQKQRSRVIRYMDFEIIGIQATGPEQAEVQVSFQSQNLHQNVLATDIVRQIWEKAGNTWYVTKIEIIEPPSPGATPESPFGLD